MVKPKLLLTGATGFLGSHLLERMLHEGFDVVIVKRSTSDLWRISHLEGQYHSFDIDLGDVAELFLNQKFDVLVHAATLYKKFEEPDDVTKMIEVNVGFPSQLLVQAVKTGVRGFINTGTFFEYDCALQPVPETSRKKPFNFYANTKLAFETILENFSDQLCINTFKLFSPFGEKDNPKLMPLIFNSAIEDKNINLSEGLQKIDLIYVHDIVNAYMKSISRMIQREFEPEFEVFNLGSGMPLSIRDIVSLVEEVNGKSINVEWGERPSKDIDVAYADISKVKNMLGWYPEIGVKKGIENSLKYYQGVKRK